MRRSEMLMTSQAQTNLGTPGPQFISLQLSFSTGDIEKTIFYTSEYAPIEPREPLGKAALLVVHGEMFALEEGAIPQPFIPLTEESGLFRIIGLAEQS